ncbi:IclR family transcriptional regulator [Breoghania sp. L-A4]|uniref:IclR family transcriptional regulator n=1 Tax=Breoghania sp. L-A4 TaxID=2304600 RepID=UPI0013C2AFF5|nr:IclR family transcriptional regulator [Breoghania sp. L-A4]
MTEGLDVREHPDTPTEARAHPANGIQVISRAASVLRSLRDEPEGLSLGQIADRVGLPRSTVQRIVNALAAERLLMAASPTGRVRLGPELIALAANSKIDLVEIVHPYLRLLSEETEETIDLAVLRKDHLVFVDQVVGSQRLRAVSAVGEVFPLHSTANGKAALSLMRDTEILDLLHEPFPCPTGNCHTTFDGLFAELAEVRESGLAFDLEENTIGISAVGAAFRDTAGTIYALSIPVPSHRFAERRDALAPRILAVRDKIRGVLGT